MERGGEKNKDYFAGFEKKRVLEARASGAMVSKKKKMEKKRGRVSAVRTISTQKLGINCRSQKRNPTETKKFQRQRKYARQSRMSRKKGAGEDRGSLKPQTKTTCLGKREESYRSTST